MKRNLYVLFQFSWCVAVLVAGITALVQFAGDPKPPDPTANGVIAGCLGFAALGILIEARRDLYSACMFLVIFSLLAALPGIVTPLLGPASPVAMRMLVVSAIIFVPALTYLVMSQFKKERYPNVLAEKFGKGAVLEYEGLQFVSLAAAQVNAGGLYEIQFFLQNCWDAPRTFAVELEAPAALRNSAAVQFDRRPSATLGPLEVGVLTIPVALAPDAPTGTLVLSVNPRVGGSGGARRRLLRGRTVDSKVSTGTTVAAAFGGAIWFGGGLKFSVDVGPSPDGAGPVQLPAVSWETVWIPGDHQDQGRGLTKIA